MEEQGCDVLDIDLQHQDQDEFKYLSGHGAFLPQMASHIILHFSTSILIINAVILGVFVFPMSSILYITLDVDAMLCYTSHLWFWNAQMLKHTWGGILTTLFDSE